VYEKLLFYTKKGSLIILRYFKRWNNITADKSEAKRSYTFKLAIGRFKVKLVYMSYLELDFALPATVFLNNNFKYYQMEQKQGKIIFTIVAFACILLLAAIVGYLT
jgi:hypothetical protein